MSFTENIDIPPPWDYYLQSKEKERHAIFQFDTKRDSRLFKGLVKPANLSATEISQIESIIKTRITQYNESALTLIKSSEKYFKQMTPVINSKGEKEVWLTCYCSVHSNWKTVIAQVSDGGSCVLYFHINLTKKRVLEFYTGGLA